MTDVVIDVQAEDGQLILWHDDAEGCQWRQVVPFGTRIEDLEAIAEEHEDAHEEGERWL